VAYSLPAPAFLQADISVCAHEFQVPAPQAYDYALPSRASEATEEVSEAAFVGAQGRDFVADGDGWHRAASAFRGLTVARKDQVRASSAPWRFMLLARRRC